MNEQQVRQASFGELVKRLYLDLSQLVDTEKKLAKKELSQKANELKRDGLEFGAGAALAGAGGLSLIASAILALATVMAAWLAALLVGVILMAVGVSALMKFKSDMQDFEPIPRNTVAGVQQDVRAMKEAIK